jgi:regulator of protease activity HflC (stomatin/prohibitin superfamily)
MWYLFFGGTRMSSPVDKEGLHLIFPWDRLFIYDTRLQFRDQDYDVVSEDGLQFRMTLTFRWRISSQNATLLQKLYGPDYVETLLVPEIGSITREVVSRHNVEVLVSDRRAMVAKEIYDRLVGENLLNGIGPEIVSADMMNTKDVIMLRDILIIEVELPEQLQRAIRNKLEQAQIIEEYKLRVEREKLESERKIVEAEGVRRFQEIVTPAISESYLKWRGIEATMELSKSPNSKIVIMGGGEGGLPVILDGFGREFPEALPKVFPGAPAEATAR